MLAALLVESFKRSHSSILLLLWVTLEVRIAMKLYRMFECMRSIAEGENVLTTPEPIFCAIVYVDCEAMSMTSQK
jgi:hypothetical protein